MKITFTVRIVADVSNDPEIGDEPTLRHVGNLLKDGKCSIEFVPSWDSLGGPTLIITEE